MATSYQSTDHSSSHKKLKQLLKDTNLGISNVSPELKKGAKSMQQHSQNTIKQVNGILSSSINGIKKKQEDDITSLHAENSTLKSIIDSHKRDSTTKMKSVECQITAHNEKLDAMISLLNNQISGLREQIIREVFHMIDQRMNTYDKKLDNVSSLSASQSMPLLNESSKIKTLYIGNDYNMPKQPAVSIEGGIHKSAPLALSVNGAVVLHDIGYTTDKKDLIPLYYDPVTNRVLIYQGK